ncbi:4335_t:CDS:2 [Rhizophagus irregularis]|nr:4335_t:CDS:2 [Rhizophagus irregularis]
MDEFFIGITIKIYCNKFNRSKRNLVACNLEALTPDIVRAKVENESKYEKRMGYINDTSSVNIPAPSGNDIRYLEVFDNFLKSINLQGLSSREERREERLIERLHQLPDKYR